jgi:tetratricopeptide (TPR) repeat protein
LIFNLPVFSQSERKLNNDGVDLYKQKKFTDAELNFRKSLEKNPESIPPKFNLGNSYYKQDKFDESLKSYQELLQKTDNKELKSKIYHNIGNSLLKSNKLEQSIEAYKNALKLNPDDLDTKYNLSYALSLLKNNQQQQQNQNQQNQKDNKQDKNQDQQQNQNQNENENKENKDKQNQQNQNEQNNNQQQKQQQSEAKISKEQAEKILEALKNNEKDLQKELRKQKGRVIKTDKDW